MFTCFTPEPFFLVLAKVDLSFNGTIMSIFFAVLCSLTPPPSFSAYSPKSRLPL